MLDWPALATAETLDGICEGRKLRLGGFEPAAQFQNSNCVQPESSNAAVGDRQDCSRELLPGISGKQTQ